MTRTPWRILAWTVGGTLFGAGLLYAGLIWIIGRTPCGYEIGDEKISPDGRLRAAVVEVNCGATTDYASWAVLGPASRPFDFEKDRLAAIDGRAMRIAWEGRKLVVFWRAERPPNLWVTRSATVEYRPL